MAKKSPASQASRGFLVSIQRAGRVTGQRSFRDQHVPQQTGVLLKLRQQEQPASMHSHMHSQQA